MDVALVPPPRWFGMPSGATMDFYTTLDTVIELLRTRGRVSYRALTHQFGLDDAGLEALLAELRYAHADSVHADARGLTWSPSDPNPAGAERRQLTVLFCDLVGSTPLSAQLDPEEFRDVVREYYDICGKVIARFDGYIAQYLGDGLIVFFGHPLAHEDDAKRAVRAGLGIVAAVEQLNVTLSERYGVALAVRLGCHTGLVVVGEVVGEARHEITALGETPNIAARLQTAAAPNTLVIGELTHQLLGGQFDCRSLGTPPLKGVAMPLEVFEVLNERTTRTRLEDMGHVGLNPLIGREAEAALLQSVWSRVASGSGHVVLVTGEAGIGKSRLIHALTEHIAQHRGRLLPCQGSPYHQDTAFHPLIDLLERVVLRFERSDAVADKRRKIQGFLTESGLPLDDTMPGLCALLSISPAPEHESAPLPPEQQKKQLTKALLDVLLHRADAQPLLLVVEDLHWVDPTTLEFLTTLTDQLHTAPVLAVFTCRPEFDSPWANHPVVSDLSLGRLAPDDVAELARAVAQGKSLPDELVAQVVERTDGVPLFVEELTKMLLESGFLEERPGRYELSGPLPTLDIPNTLHDSLMARLDRLSTVKGLAQLGATIGREFSYPLLRAVAPWDDDLLGEALAQLVTAEFLFQTGVPPEATYRFKHALIQDAAYQSLLRSARRQHHQRIAAALESGFPDLVANQPELLAQHYTEARLVSQAIPYWEAAGRRALQRCANHEAANHASRGLELLGTMPETADRARQELALQLLLGASMTFVSGPHSGAPNYTRARELAREIGAVPEMFPALAGLGYAEIVSGHMHEARALAEEFLELAPRDDPLLPAVGHWLLAYTAWWQGDFVDVHVHSRQGLDHYQPDRHGAFVAAYANDPGIVCGYLSALSDWVLGYPELAVRTMKSTVTGARDSGDPASLGLALLMSAQLAQLRREPDLARAHAEQALAVADEHGHHAVSLWCRLPRGWALAQQGDPARGLADIAMAMDRRRGFGIRAVWPWFLALAAEIRMSLGDFEQARDDLDEAEQWVAHNDERLYAAEVLRLKGELLRRTQPAEPELAQECFKRALASARIHQATSWELRSATSLARMWMDGGRGAEAFTLLSPVYDRFTEGFGTRDLIDAKALLDRLGR